ncbi:relaxase domain-containing protein [Streptomyces microflavus]
MEIAGVPHELIRWTSRRSDQITACLTELEHEYVTAVDDDGEPRFLPVVSERARAKLNQIAARKTRPPKQKTLPLAQLRAWWKTSAILTSGVAADIITSLLEHARAAAAAIRADRRRGRHSFGGRRRRRDRVRDERRRPVPPPAPARRNPTPPRPRPARPPPRAGPGRQNRGHRHLHLLPGHQRTEDRTRPRKPTATAERDQKWEAVRPVARPVPVGAAAAGRGAARGEAARPRGAGGQWRAAGTRGGCGRVRGGRVRSGPGRPTRLRAGRPARVRVERSWRPGWDGVRGSRPVQLRTR